MNADNNQAATAKGSCTLTTTDNPFDPFDNFTEWYLFDTDKGYNSCAYLARIAKTSDQLTDEENQDEIERAVDEIISCDFLNIYKKVYIKEPKQMELK